MQKFNNKYRIPSARLKNWDYGQNGIYFITICSENRFHYFGEVVNGEMVLNEIGILADKYWNEIVAHFPFVELGNFVIMPNHVHGILIIDKNASVETRLIASALQSQSSNSSAETQENTGGFAGNKNPMLQENISRIIRWYKGRCSFEIRKINPNFAWQSRFHDHIIRNSISFENIQNYIANNPKKWQEDKFY